MTDQPRLSPTPAPSAAFTHKILVFSPTAHSFSRHFSLKFGRFLVKDSLCSLIKSTSHTTINPLKILLPTMLFFFPQNFTGFFYNLQNKVQNL